MKIEEIVESTAAPTFSVKLNGTIIAWNRAAERFFGLKKTKTLTRNCWDVLSGKDVFGNPYCREGCPLLEMGRRREAISPCHLCVETASGESVRVGVCTLVAVVESHVEGVLIHQLSTAAPADSIGDLIPRESVTNPAGHRLTPRELEVLALLAEGKGTQEIAGILCISNSTTRNHIRRILRKLNAHSRLEAIARARHLGLL